MVEFGKIGTVVLSNDNAISADINNFDRFLLIHVYQKKSFIAFSLLLPSLGFYNYLGIGITRFDSTFS